MARCASSRANSAWRRAISARAATTPSEDGTTMLKIFGQARSRTFRVLWLCEESSIPYEHIPVSIKSDDAQCKEPWYLALNPAIRVQRQIPWLLALRIVGFDADRDMLIRNRRFLAQPEYAERARSRLSEDLQHGCAVLRWGSGSPRRYRASPCGIRAT